MVLIQSKKKKKKKWFGLVWFGLECEVARFRLVLKNLKMNLSDLFENFLRTIQFSINK